MNKPNATPKRRWLRFSLRTLLVLVLLLSVPLGWFAVKLRQAEKQRKAVATIRQAGGSVGYDYESHGESEPAAPAWLRDVLGDDFFSTARSVSFLRAPKDGDVGDGIFGHFKELPKLELLQLHSLQVTDVGLQNLEGLSELRFIDLSYTKVTDAGLGHLEGLTELEYLDLDGTAITNAGLEHLKSWAQLKALRVTATLVTDDGLGHLVESTELEWLDLRGTQITDAGLKNLKGLTRLEQLDLSYTRVADPGLENLKALTKLEHLNLSGTCVTEQGVDELRQALPNCEIEWPVARSQGQKHA